MDHRTDSFFRRFTRAQSHLKVQDIYGLVSLKYRNDHPDFSHSDYPHFIHHYLKGELHFNVKQVASEFGEQAWLVSDKSQNSVILVEHETGLEILSALSSIATLIPLISSGWTKLRDKFSHRHFDHPNSGVEVRRFDQSNVLIEEQTPSVEVFILNIIQQDNALLRQKVQQLEAEIDKIKQKQLPKRKTKAVKSRRRHT